MKKLNWKIVAPNSLTEEAFWSKTREDRLGSPDMFDELNSLFATNLPKDKSKEETAAGGPKKVQKKGKELKVLDTKAAQTLGTNSFQRRFV